MRNSLDNQQAMMTRFKAAMSKMQVLGQHGLTDCSDVIPVPKPFRGPIKFPGSFSQKDVQIAVSLMIYQDIKDH